MPMQLYTYLQAQHTTTAPAEPFPAYVATRYRNASTKRKQATMQTEQEAALWVVFRTPDPAPFLHFQDLTSQSVDHTL